MLPQAVARGATYFLDAVYGNNSNPGTSEAPWLTLNKAKSIVQAGGSGLYFVHTEAGDYKKIVVVK